MSLIALVITLILIGVLLWLVNTQLGQFIAPPILTIINVLVVVVVVIWIVGILLGWESVSSIRVPTLRGNTE